MTVFVPANKYLSVLWLSEIAARAGADTIALVDSFCSQPNLSCNKKIVTDCGPRSIDERDVRTFAQHARNTLDLAAVPAVRRISHLDADGLMIEMHSRPERTLSDGAQALDLEEYEQMVREVRAIHDLIA